MFTKGRSTRGRYSRLPLNPYLSVEEKKGTGYLGERFKIRECPKNKKIIQRLYFANEIKRRLESASLILGVYTRAKLERRKETNKTVNSKR